MNLLSLEWLQSIEPQGYRTQPSQFGEQVIPAGLSFEHISSGTRLQLGTEAILEITKTRTGCERLEVAQGKSISRIGPIGILAMIIVGGTINVGDQTKVIDTVRPIFNVSLAD